MSDIVFITGATSGIGEACAELFAARNYGLILNGRREERLRALADRLSAAHSASSFLLPFDVRDKRQTEAAIENLPPAWKHIDVLINNAGLALGFSPFQEGEIADWETMIDTNLKGLLYVSRAVAPLMAAAKRGHIINIGSIAGKEPYPNGNVYCATKHAVDSLSRGMRMDLLSHRVKVTTINPGAVETEFSVIRFKGNEERAGSVYEGFDPLTARDIAEAVYFAASRPAHVNIDDMTVMPAAQAGAAMFNRETKN